MATRWCDENGSWMSNPKQQLSTTTAATTTPALETAVTEILGATNTIESIVDTSASAATSNATLQRPTTNDQHVAAPTNDISAADKLADPLATLYQGWTNYTQCIRSFSGAKQVPEVPLIMQVS